MTADAQTKVAGEPDPALTYQVTSGSLAFSDAFSGELARDAGEDAGAYAIRQGTLALDSNYELTYVGADLTILPAAVNTAPTANPGGPYLGRSTPPSRLTAAVPPTRRTIPSPTPGPLAMGAPLTQARRPHIATPQPAFITSA